MISKKFIKTSAMYTLAGALPMASAIILLPFYTYFLPINEYGALSVYTSFSMLLQVIITYSFDSSLYIHFHEYKNEPKKLALFVSSAFIFMAMTGLVVSLIASGFGTLLFDKIFIDKPISFFPYGFLSVITSVFQSFFKVSSSLLQSREKPVQFFWSNVISFSLIALLTIAGLLLFPNTLVGPVGGRMLAAVISGVWTLYRIFKEFGTRYDYSLLKSSFGYNAATFIYQIQQWLIANFDRFLMTYYLTLSIVGTYDFALKCFMAIDFILQGLSNSFYPKVISQVMDQGDNKKESTIVINRYYHGLIAVMMLLVSGSILFFPILFESGVVQSGYKESWKYIPYIGLIYLLRGMRYYFSFPYGALKYSKPLPIIYLIVSVAKIALMYFFIPQYGVFAVIASTIISSVIEIVLLRTVIMSKFEFKFNVFKIVVAPVVLGICILFTELLIPLNIHLRHLLYILLCGIILWWMYRNELRDIRVSWFLKN